MADAKHPLPIGVRVHHRGGVYSVADSGGGHYWGTVREVKPQRDGSFEYRVDPDEPMFKGGGQWASYHIDRVLEPA